MLNDLIPVMNEITVIIVRFGEPLYLTTSLVPGNRDSLNVKLQPDVNALGEIIVTGVSEGDEVVGLKKITGDNIIVLSTTFKMLIFSVKELPLLKKGKGVRLQRYKEESLLDVMLFPENVRK